MKRTPPLPDVSALAVPARFGFTDDHDLLRQTARRVLSERCPVSLVRALADAEAESGASVAGADAADVARGGAGGAARGPEGVAALWREIGELGWPGIAVGEARGGAGLDVLSLALVLEEAGRALLPAPLWSTALAAIAVERMGSDAHAERWLPRLCDGACIGALAFTEPDGGWDGVSAVATAAGDGAVLAGVKTHVAWGADADVILAPFRLDGALRVFAVEPGGGGGGAGARRVVERCVDPTRPMARVELADLAVGSDARLPRGDEAAWRDVRAIGAVLLAAEMVGASEGILARTRDYAAERVQFGRPIGAFQAVKHPLVDVMVGVERARSVVYGAAAALSGSGQEAAGPGGLNGAARALAHMAKAAATDALWYAADRGVQLHGGFGFTWDCDAHLFMKRALWSAGTLGDAAYHRAELARLLLD